VNVKGSLELIGAHEGHAFAPCQRESLFAQLRLDERRAERFEHALFRWKGKRLSPLRPGRASVDSLFRGFGTGGIDEGLRSG
jgi:hypothetical protein